MAEEQKIEGSIRILVSGPNPPFDFALQGDYLSLLALVGGLALVLKHPDMNNAAGTVLKVILDCLIDHLDSLPEPFPIPAEAKEERRKWKECQTIPFPLDL